MKKYIRKILQSKFIRNKYVQNKYVKKIILPAIVVYLAICIYSFSIANICASIFILICIPAIIIKKTLLRNNKLTKEKVKTHFFADQNTLKNGYVIVRYESEESLYVQEDPNSNTAKRDLKYFRVFHNPYKDLDTCWYEICERFDKYTMFENLYDYFGGNVAVEVVSRRKVLAMEANIEQVEKRIVDETENEVYVDINKIKTDESNINEPAITEESVQSAADNALDEILNDVFCAGSDNSESKEEEKEKEEIEETEDEDAEFIQDLIDRVKDELDDLDEENETEEQTEQKFEILEENSEAQTTEKQEETLEIIEEEITKDIPEEGPIDTTEESVEIVEEEITKDAPEEEPNEIKESEQQEQSLKEKLRQELKDELKEELKRELMKELLLDSKKEESAPEESEKEPQINEKEETFEKPSGDKEIEEETQQNTSEEESVSESSENSVNEDENSNAEAMEKTSEQTEEEKEKAPTEEELPEETEIKHEEIMEDTSKKEEPKEEIPEEGPSEEPSDTNTTKEEEETEEVFEDLPIEQTNNIPQEEIEAAIEKEKQNTGDFFDFSDLAKKNKTQININSADSSEIAILPGINIILAKKIVEHRQVNGYFKTAEEFLEIAQVKKHFADQIKERIILDIPEKHDDNENSDQNRVVD